MRANIEAGPENDWIKHNQDNHDNHRTMSDGIKKENDEHGDNNQGGGGIQ